mmetsp:Transcript_88139/g.246628  ORF Transcript_88139/g.246628 Transcript_88139/m.246628 type:complete len:84 (-) Transcript_88139:483-734(-)
MQGMQQHVNTRHRTGATIQMRFPNSQIRNPHREGVVVMSIQNPINQTSTNAMDTKPKEMHEQSRHFERAVHSHAPVTKNTTRA